MCLNKHFPTLKRLLLTRVFVFTYFKQFTEINRTRDYTSMQFYVALSGLVVPQLLEAQSRTSESFNIRTRKHASIHYYFLECFRL